MIELRAFGPPGLLHADGRPVTSVMAQPRRLALLAWLALAGADRVHRRDTLLAVFWPESDDERARAALRQAVRFLRRSLGDGIIVSRGDDELAIGEDVLSCDVTAFEDAVRAGNHARALELYRGPLLDGFFIDDAPGWDQWLEGERDRLRRRAADCAGHVADGAAAAGDWPAALTAARQASALAPGDEHALRRLLEILARSGDRAGAVAEFERHAAWLAAELELEPDAGTAALVAAIRGGSGREVATESGAPRGAAGPEPGAGEPDGDRGPMGGPGRADAAKVVGGGGGGGGGGGAVGRSASVRRRARWAVAAVAMLALTWAGWSAWPARGTGDLHVRRVLVAPFENLTGDTALDVLGRMAADRIIHGLTEMGGLEVLPFSTVVSPAAQAQTGMLELAREVGAGRLVAGSYYLQGGRMLIQARVTDVASGGVLRALDAVDIPPDSPLVAVELLRARLRATLAPEVHPESHARATTPAPSYEAYREYILGMEAFMRMDVPASLRHMERAAAGEAGWAMPRIVTSIMHMNLGNWPAVDSVAREVELLRESLGPLELATHEMVVAWTQGDDGAAYQAVLRQRQLAPGTIAHYQVAEQARRLNRPREALRVLRELAPPSGEPGGELRGWRPYWREMTWSHHMLGQHRRELRAARRARALYPDDGDVLLSEARALAALGRVTDVEPAVQRRLEWPAQAAPSPGIFMRVLGLELGAHGRAEAGRLLQERAADWYASRPPAERPRFRYSLAATLYDLDRYDEARAIMLDLVRENPNDVGANAYLGLIAAATGDEEEARRISAWLQDLEIPFLFGRPSYLQARIAARLGDPAEAARLIREAMARGTQYSPDLHLEPEFRPHWRHRDMAALLRPAG